MKKWYYFKEGTQWIYQEVTTGELDTATVFNSIDGDTWFDFYVLHSKGDWIVNYYFDTSWSIYCLTSKECNCHKVFRSRGKPGNYVGEGGIFVYPNIVGNYNNIVGFPNGQITGGTTTLAAADLEFITANDTLNEVIRWEVSTDQSMHGWSSAYEIAIHIGIVRMAFPHFEEDWKLIEFSIIQ